MESFSNSNQNQCPQKDRISTPYKGPTRAWLANVNGSTGLIMLMGLGFTHVAPTSATNISDNVPGDMTVNYLFALIWDHVTHRRSSKLEVYNYGSSDWNPICNKTGTTMVLNIIRDYPVRKMVWYPTVTYIPNFHVFLVIHVLLTIIPAAIYDLIRIVRNKKTIALNMTLAANKLVIVTQPFFAATWIIKSNKAKNLLRRMNAADSEEFNFDLSLLDWYDYLQVAVDGFRMFMKEAPKDLIIARKKYRKLQIVHYTVCGLFALFLLFVLYKIARCIS